jgi:uncharacterized protein (DUF362 family)/NAD-dependent dihydropyrimidine dehydrogenase PreA subunit
MKPKVSVRKIDSYQLESVKAALKDFLDAAGPTRLDHANTVLIKPNLLGGFPPEKAVTTHPTVLEALIQLLLEKQKEVWLGDSPGGNIDIEETWKICGVQALAEKYSVRLVNFSRYGVQEIDHSGYKIRPSKITWEADAIINIGKMKTHSLMAYTGAVKNLFGLVPGLAKSAYHREHPEAASFGHMLAALYHLVRHRVAYHILDGIVGMDGAGPSAGRPRNFGLLLGSTSGAALDYIASGYMGFSLGQVPYVREAMHGEGIIPAQVETPISFNHFKLQKVNIRVVLFNSYLMKLLPASVKYVVRHLYNFYPQITDKCVACGICVGACPVSTIKMENGRKPIIYAENCIRCLCCHEMCPHNAIIIHKTLMARLLTPDKRRRKI